MNMELLSCPAVCPLECFSVHSAQFFLLPHIHTEGIYGIYGRVYGTWYMVYGTEQSSTEYIEYMHNKYGP